MQILSSDDGRKTGTTNDQKIGGALLPGPFMSVGGFIAGPHGKQHQFAGPSCASFWDDFDGNALSTRWKLIEGTDSATSDAAPLSGGIGGVLRITTGDAGTGLAADQIEVLEILQWKSEGGGLAFQTRLKLSAITTCYGFMGFTDQAASLEAPIESAASGDTITTNATDAVGFMFDTRMATDNWWLVGVANDVDATAQNSALAPVADTYQTFRLEIDKDGNASFFINGAPIGTKMSGAVTKSVALVPIITFGKTSVAASMTIDVDYAHVAMVRNADGGSY